MFVAILNKDSMFSENYFVFQDTFPLANQVKGSKISHWPSRARLNHQATQRLQGIYNFHVHIKIFFLNSMWIHLQLSYFYRTTMFKPKTSSTKQSSAVKKKPSAGLLEWVLLKYTDSVWVLKNSQISFNTNSKPKICIFLL